MIHINEEQRIQAAAIILAGLCSNYENNIPSAMVGDAVKLTDSLLKRLSGTNRDEQYQRENDKQ